LLEPQNLKNSQIPKPGGIFKCICNLTYDLDMQTLKV